MTMTPLAAKAMRGATLALLGAGAAAGVYAGWKQYGRVDPYAEVPKPKHVVDPKRAIVASGVRFKHYENGKLVVGAQANGLTVNQNRSAVTLQGIANGTAQTPKGALGFSGDSGVMNPNLRTVQINGHARIVSKAQGLDIVAPVAQIDGRRGDLMMPSTLKGTIAGGRIAAGSLVLNPGQDALSLKRVAWTGKLPRSQEVPASQQNRTWIIHADETEKRGPTEIATIARAEDGEVIVTAPKIVRDSRTDIITATGRATYRSAKADIVADQVVVHRKEGYAVCTGNVVMLTRPKSEWDRPMPKPTDDADTKPLDPPLPPDLAGGKSGDPLSEADRAADDALRSGKTINKYPMSLKADEVTYWYRKGNRHAIAKGGNPTAFQRFDPVRWRQVWAPEAHYDAEKDMLDLVGDRASFKVHMKNSIGDTLDTIWLQVSTKEDQAEEDEYMKYGKSKSSYVSRGEEDDEVGGGATKPTTPPKKDPPKSPPGGTPPPAKSASSTKGAS